MNKITRKNKCYEKIEHLLKICVQENHELRNGLH